MEIHIQKSEPEKIAGDTLLIPFFEDEKTHSALFQTVDKAVDGRLSAEVEELGFTGKEGMVIMLQTQEQLPMRRVFVCGLGKQEKCTQEKLRCVTATLGKKLREFRQKHVITPVFAEQKLGLDESVTAMVEGFSLGGYQYDKYHDEKKKKKDTDHVQILTIAVADVEKVKKAEQSLAEALLGVRGTVLARDLVNEPASVATPVHLVEHARRIAAEQVGVKVTILTKDDVAKLGMGAFLAVAAGATEESFFIHLQYKPKTKTTKSIAIVGKGITFDSGGLQIKPGEHMTTMKCDMAGSATVLGLFSVIGEVKPYVEVHGIIAATENMPGNSAYKPGDVVRCMNGKTIEIGHTDAEGRVTLADALAYAVTKKPDMIIDLATLTGAAVAALGEEYTALMTNNPKFGERVKKAAAEAGERMWELPLAEEYRDLVKGEIADLKNVSLTRYGGAITAGLFLENFVAGLPWVHLDIAGPAFAERESIPYMPKGGTGYGVRTLIRLLKGL